MYLPLMTYIVAKIGIRQEEDCCLRHYCQQESGGRFFDFFAPESFHPAIPLLPLLPFPHGFPVFFPPRWYNKKLIIYYYI